MSAHAGQTPLAPAVVSDMTCEIVGLKKGRQFRALLAEHPEIPRWTWRRHTFARVEDVVRAMGLLAAGAPTAAADEEPAWDRARVVEMAARRGRK